MEAYSARACTLKLGLYCIKVCQSGTWAVRGAVCMLPSNSSRMVGARSIRRCRRANDSDPPSHDFPTL